MQVTLPKITMNFLSLVRQGNSLQSGYDYYGFEENRDVHRLPDYQICEAGPGPLNLSLKKHGAFEITISKTNDKTHQKEEVKTFVIGETHTTPNDTTVVFTNNLDGAKRDILNYMPSFDLFKNWK